MPDALVVHRIAFHHRVHAGQNVAQIAVTEIAHVGARELFAVPVTAARIRHEDEVALRGKQLQRQPRPRPAGRDLRSRTAVHHNHHRIALGRIVRLRKNQPALHIEIVALPFHALRFAPSSACDAASLECVICCHSPVRPAHTSGGWFHELRTTALTLAIARKAHALGALPQ